VTGGCGFIGSNFIRYILQHYKPASVTNVDALTYAGNLANLDGVVEEHGERYEFFKADIANADATDALMLEHQFFAVVNFAAESHVDRSINSPENFIHTNVIGTSVLLNSARKHGVQRFVQISTDEVYGSLGKTGKFTEQSPLDPSSPYSSSKAGADLLALAHHKTYGQEVVVTRCSNNYGPYQFPEKLIPLMIIKALRDDPCSGPLRCRRRCVVRRQIGHGLQFRRRQRDAEPRAGENDSKETWQTREFDFVRERPARARSALRD
jgi:dTDP-glucose 4,6-dehydratase